MYVNVWVATLLTCWTEKRSGGGQLQSGDGDIYASIPSLPTEQSIWNTGLFMGTGNIETGYSASVLDAATQRCLNKRQASSQPFC